MGRKYKRKTDSPRHSEEQIQASIKLLESGGSLRKVAEETGLPKSSLQRYYKKFNERQPDKPMQLAPDFKQSQVFSTEQEEILAEYVKKSAKMFHGLTSDQMRRLAYELAKSNELKFPKSWEENKKAGEVWLQGFIERSKTLSRRVPEPTSVARATAFNQHNINIFFNNLESTYAKTKVTAHNIYNLDETGLTTTHKPPRIITSKGEKQVGQIVSQERGELITVCGIVSAAGISVPPVIIFPRKNYRDIFLRGAPEGSRGLCSPSGWMNADLFIEVLRHFISFVNPSVERQVVLVCDNHDSHISLQAVEFAKDNYIHIITLPPHTSHKTQPLDRSVYGPLKSYFNAAANSWMLRNPGRPISIYEMGELIGESWKRAATPENIMSGFRASGIWPFDHGIFSSEAFLPSDVTDRPFDVVAQPDLQQSVSPSSAPPQLDLQQAIPGTSASPQPDLQQALPCTSSAAAQQDLQQALPCTSSAPPQPDLQQALPCTSSAAAQQDLQQALPCTSSAPPQPDLQQALPGTSSAPPQPDLQQGLPRTSAPPQPDLQVHSTPMGLPTERAKTFLKVTPEEIRAYPKAPARKSSRGRKKGRSMVATSSPEIKRMRVELLAKVTKNPPRKTKGLNPKKLFDNYISESESDDDLSIEDIVGVESESADESGNVKSIELGEVETVRVGEYVLCEFATKKTLKYFVGIVTKDRDDEDDVEVDFFRRQSKYCNNFVKPPSQDINSVNINSVKAILPPPKERGTTKRTKGMITFDCITFDSLPVF